MKLNPHRLDLLNRFLLLCALIFGATSFSLKSSAELAASGPPTNNRTTNQPTSDRISKAIARAKELIEECKRKQQPNHPQRQALFCCAEAGQQLILEFNKEFLKQIIDPIQFNFSCTQQAIGQQGEDYEVLKAKISSKQIRVYKVNGKTQNLDIDMKGTIGPGGSEEDIKKAFQREITVIVQDQPGCSLPDNFWNAQTGTGKLMVRDFVRPQSSSWTQEYQLKVKLNCRL